MKNKEFDMLVRRRAMSEQTTLSGDSEARIQSAMREPVSEGGVRRMTLRMAVALVLMVALLCGAGLAAVNWNSRQYMTSRDSEGNERVNEAVLEHLQAVGMDTGDRAVQILMEDAAFDGYSVVLAWTAQNRLEETVYLLCTVYVDGVEIGGVRQNASEMFMEPGELLTSGASGAIKEEMDGSLPEREDSCEVLLEFTVLKPKWERVEAQLPDAEDKWPAFDEEVLALWNGQKIVTFGGSMIYWGGFITDWEAGPRGQAHTFENTGAFEIVDEIDMRFTLERNEKAKTKPKHSEMVEKANEDYTLRVVHADMTSNQLTLALEVVFTEQEAMDKYKAYFDPDNPLGPAWRFTMHDQDGEQFWFSAGHSSMSPAPEWNEKQQAWVWRYQLSSDYLKWIPETVVIVPTRDEEGYSWEEPYDPERADIPYPDEAIEITF